MAVVVVLTGICVAGVLFLLRFFIALCQERAPGDAAHLFRVTPAPAGSHEPGADEGESAKLSSLSEHRSVRRRHTNQRPAATGRSAAPIELHRVTKSSR
jgi:hypothetical protein